MDYSKVSDETSLDHGERLSLSSTTGEKASLCSITEVAVADLIDISSDPGMHVTSLCLLPTHIFVLYCAK